MTGSFSGSGNVPELSVEVPYKNTEPESKQESQEKTVETGFATEPEEQ